MLSFVQSIRAGPNRPRVDYATFRERVMREDPKFGTDGVRGVANADLSAFFAFRLGRVAGGLLSRKHTGRTLLSTLR